MSFDMCSVCGSKEWELLWHGDGTFGGTWTYICSKCGKTSIIIIYSEHGFDEWGKPLDISKQSVTGEKNDRV